MKRGKRGFSYIEVMIAVTLVVMASLGGALQLSKFYRAEQEQAAWSGIAATLRDASARAVAQQGGMQWGVRFENFAQGDRYALFMASSSALDGFVTSSVTYLPRTAQFSDSWASSAVVFAKLTGDASFSGCPSGTASSTATVGTHAVRVYCNGKIE